MSADPLEVHAVGDADDNVYAYVRGGGLGSVDPLGLEEQSFNNPKVQADMDRFLESWRARVDVGRTSYRVSVPFLMETKNSAQSKAAATQLMRNLKTYGHPPRNYVLVLQGKGSPQDFARFAQWYATRPGVAAATPGELRTSLSRLGAGVDCSGFTWWDHYAYSGRAPRGSANPTQGLALDDFTRGRTRAGWERVSILEAQTGDKLLFANYDASGNFLSGHKTTVYSHSVDVLAPDWRMLMKQGDGIALFGGSATGDKIHRFEVDAAWGGVGAERRTYYYSEATKQWWNPEAQQPQQSPYHYPISGVFREK